MSRSSSAEVEQSVEGVCAALLGDRRELLPDELGMRGRLHDLVGVPPRRDALVLLPCVAHLLPPTGIRVRSAALFDRARHELGEHRVRVEVERLDEVHGERQRAARDLRPHVRSAGSPLTVDLRGLQMRTARHREHCGVGDRSAEARLEVVALGERHPLATVDSDDAAATATDRPAQRLGLLGLSDAARDGSTIRTDVRQRHAGREAGRARLHRLVDQRHHCRDLVGGRGSIGGLRAEHVEPQRRVPDVGGVVERRPAPAHRVEVFGKRLELLPRDPGREALGIHVLDLLHRATEQVAIGGPSGRDAEPAVARYHGRDTVVAGRRERGIPEHLRVVVSVDVDEAGRDDATVRVDQAITAQASADLDDAVTLDRDIRGNGGCSRPVDDLPSCNHHTVHATLPSARAVFPAQHLTP